MPSSGPYTDHLPLGHLGAVALPLDLLVLDQGLEHRIPKGLAQELALLGYQNGLVEVLGKLADAQLCPLLLAHLVDVAVHHGGQLVVVDDALQARRQHAGEGQVGVAGRIRGPELDAGGLLLPRLVFRHPD